MTPFSYPDNQLQYILVKGELKHISEYEGLPQDRRPENAQCPECKEFVVLKTIARKLRAHFAHKVDNQCPANSNEGAAHLNTKLYIKTLLTSFSKVETRLYCTKRGCYSSPKVIFAEWDEVQDEYYLQGKRLDIGVLRDGKLIGAIEVHDTSEITEEKTALLNELSIPWIEVKAKMDSDHIILEKSSTLLFEIYDRITPGEYRNCSLCGGKLSSIPFSSKKVVKMRILDFYEETGSYGGPLRAIYFFNVKIERGFQKEWMINKVEYFNDSTPIHSVPSKKITVEEYLDQESETLLKDEYWRTQDGRFSVDDWGWCDTSESCTYDQSMTTYKPNYRWDKDRKEWRCIQDLVDEVYGVRK